MTESEKQIQMQRIIEHGRLLETGLDLGQAEGLLEEAVKLLYSKVKTTKSFALRARIKKFLNRREWQKKPS